MIKSLLRRPNSGACFSPVFFPDETAVGYGLLIWSLAMHPNSWLSVHQRSSKACFFPLTDSRHFRGRTSLLHVVIMACERRRHHVLPFCATFFDECSGHCTPNDESIISIIVTVRRLRWLSQLRTQRQQPQVSCSTSQPRFPSKLTISLLTRLTHTVVK